MSEILVKSENIGKKFCKTLKKSMFYGISDVFKNSLGFETDAENLRKDEFWAVNDVSFELKRGEILGIIGPNGSGKSTLLKMLNGIFMPDKGIITIKGRVGALIQVGAGFHSMLTGRENIYLNGIILGMNKKEIEKKFDSIVEFADIGDFLDSPVKYYSSGMYVRLGFAIAIHCNPDILLIDEILAVGDEKFRRKCYVKIEELIKNSSIILVSHSMFQIERLCHKVLYLKNGKINFLGEPREVIKKYHTDSNVFDNDIGIKKEELVKFNDIYFTNNNGARVKSFNIFDDMNLFIDFELIENLTRPHFSVRFYLAEGIRISEINFEPEKFKSEIKNHSLSINIKKASLPVGKYYVEIRFSEKSHVAGVWMNALYFDVTTEDFTKYPIGNTFCSIDAQCNCS